MSREIKFRAYIEDEGRFIYCDDSEENHLGTFFTAVKQIEEMSGKKVPKDQFTGLTDKNGKEIYAGDILRAYRKTSGWRGRPERIEELIFKVYFDESAASFKIHYPNMGWDSYMGLDAPYEVIGNIYENPDLLKSTPR